MTPVEKIAIVSLLVSCAAAVTALVALWRSHLAPFQPVVVVGDLGHRIYTIGDQARRWYISSFDLTVTVTNEGARTGHVLGLRLRVTFPELPITGHYELLPVTFEIPHADTRKITAERFNWIEEIPAVHWVPFVVLARESKTKHFIFETRWEDPVIQNKVDAQLEVLTSAEKAWRPVGRFQCNLTPHVWAQMVHGGSAFSYSAEGSPVVGRICNPPDLHKHTGTEAVLPTSPPVPPTQIVLPTAYDKKNADTA